MVGVRVRGGYHTLFYPPAFMVLWLGFRSVADANNPNRIMRELDTVSYDKDFKTKIKGHISPIPFVVHEPYVTFNAGITPCLRLFSLSLSLSHTHTHTHTHTLSLSFSLSRSRALSLSLARALFLEDPCLCR